MQGKSKIQLAEWAVHIAEIHVLRQMEIIEELRADGHATAEPERLLALFEQTLKSHEWSLEQLRGEHAPPAVHRVS
ncbi:MAG: hypothetical protein JO256_08145 [Alphaproteobacteria bacterium]|nr:hypothetical protein [Alphaproteobacteria bacterium]